VIDATAYRIAARALFAPFGGLAQLRHHAVEALQLQRGARVLELGCGPGDVTATLLDRGAVVDAVDASEEMLRAAAARAPGARYLQADVRTYRPRTTFDAMLLVFILHEIPVADIPPMLSTVTGSLAPGGRLVVVDHAVPRGVSGQIWRRSLHVVESRAVDAWLALDPARLARQAGLVVELDEELAGGRAHLVAARRAGVSS